MIFSTAFHTSRSYESVAGCSLLKCYRYDSFAKIVQTEWNSKYIADYFEIPEVTPIFAAQRQSSANRVEYQTKYEVFVCIPEPTPIFATKVKYTNSIPLLTCKHAPFCLINEI